MIGSLIVGRHRPDSLADRAYGEIRDKILRGDCPLGAALSRRSLAKEMGMSFLPLSEALQRLERDGLVESKPRVGTRVRIPSGEDVCERYMLREALETQAARVYVERAESAEREELLRMGRHLDQLYSCAASPGADADFLFSVHTYHMKFHLRIAEGAGCGLLREAIEREQVLIFNWLFDTAAQRRTLPPNFHANLALALTGGDVVRADAAMREHIRLGMEQVLEALAPKAAPNGWRLRRGGAKPRTTAVAGDSWRRALPVPQRQDLSLAARYSRSTRSTLRRLPASPAARPLESVERAAGHGDPVRTPRLPCHVSISRARTAVSEHR
jgi:DNA-binding GntR family transcriptional regulator